MQLESPGGHGSGCGPIPEKFLMYGVYVYSLVSSLPLLTSQRAQGFYRAEQERGTSASDNIVPVQSLPGPKPIDLVPDREQV